MGNYLVVLEIYVSMTVNLKTIKKMAQVHYIPNRLEKNFIMEHLKKMRKMVKV